MLLVPSSIFASAPISAEQNQKTHLQQLSSIVYLSE